MSADVLRSVAAVIDPDDVGTTRAVYDATADAYVEAIGTELSPAFEGPIERGLLAAFMEMVGTATRPIGDLGCGPGRIAAFLARSGVSTVALDLSPQMLVVGRRAHPDLPFAAAELRRLPLSDRSLDGAVSWYSTIHTPPSQLHTSFAEVARTLTAGAPLLVAFQTADDAEVVRPDAHGSSHTLRSYRHRPETVADALTQAGFDVCSTTVREPMLEHESTRQAFVFALVR